MMRMTHHLVRLLSPPPLQTEELSQVLLMQHSELQAKFLSQVQPIVQLKVVMQLPQSWATQGAAIASSANTTKYPISL